MSEENLTLAFVVKADTIFGQCVRVVGSTPELGLWDPAKAPALQTDPGEYPKWFGNVTCSGAQRDVLMQRATCSRAAKHSHAAKDNIQKWLVQYLFSVAA
eukprot:symbB.v1.2.029020.t1/scaffold3125.1/size63008/7